MKHKVLIIGPIEDLGGRELEAGFVASVLKEDFDVDVLSTGNLKGSSQFYEIVDGIKMTSLKQMLYKKNWILRPATILSYLRNRRKEPLFFYVNNKVNSRLIKPQENNILQKIIKKYDLIFIIAHLQTLRTKEIIEFSRKLKKPVIFRTTGEIELSGGAPAYLKNVNLFLHHSRVNANNLHKILKINNYALIDQNSYMEPELIKIPIIQRPIQNFAVIGRFSPEKNILGLISFFKKCSSQGDNLFIVGDGEERSIIEKEAAGWNNISILGQLSSRGTAELLGRIDCLIISSLTEAGPLVGVEAMAAARIILSTRVGAMPDRLKETNNNFWFEAKNYNSFKIEYLRLKNLESEIIEKISVSNRSIYLKNHCKMNVSEKYSNAVKEIVKC